MSKFDKKSSFRYTIITVMMTFFTLVVLAKAVKIMTVDRSYWERVAQKEKRDSLTVKPVRGNILSDDGRLMASSLPEFKVYMDFPAGGEEKDSLLMLKMDSICEGLHYLFPEKTAEEFRSNLMEGRKKQSRHWPIYKQRINYNTFSEVKNLPLFNLKPHKGGFHFEEFNARNHPFKSLAGRTVGDMFGAKDTARYGLELSYDSILRGKNGVIHRRKVLNKFLSITDTPPVDGCDIQTTIDVNMQDIAERALVNELKDIDGDVGVAIIMEVATGDVKAIVNMDKCADGEYREIKNHAVSDLLEPGSVFKTASILVALDDGVIDTTYRVETGGGVWNMYGRDMKDHNWRRGGYGTMSVSYVLEQSSNIGVSRIIDNFYKDNPSRFVEGIHRVGMSRDLKLPIKGSSAPWVRSPKTSGKGHNSYWSKTTLPWMSIGYETQVPPISVCAFYNGIANNGKMMRPRFVKEVRKDGEIIDQYAPEVLVEQMARPEAIGKIQTILKKVVSVGLGKRAGSKAFKVAGKTGTAQISKGSGGYRSGTMHYLLSFAGYFPADAPRYTCVVCIQKAGSGSGGGMSGKVFHEISEGIMAQSLKQDVTDSRDSIYCLLPKVKNGNMDAASYVLDFFNIKNSKDNSSQDGNQKNGKTFWGIASTSSQKVEIKQSATYGKGVMPNVIGMGARDAVYDIERRGVKVRIIGRGKVQEQSISAGTNIVKGMVCSLRLG